MKKWLLILPILFSGTAFAQIGAITNFCEVGATHAITSGLQSSNYQQGVIPGCTVTVYLTGTTNYATIYADSSETTLTNPFTAATDGQWLFYAATNQGYDIVLSSGITLTDVFAGSSSGVGAYLPLAGGTITGNLTVLGSFVTSGMTTPSLATPTSLVGVPSSSGGLLTAGTYYAEVTAVDGSGNTTVASSETSATTTGSTGSIVWTWSPVVNAFSYQLYVGTSSRGETAYFSASTYTYTQTVLPATPLSVQSTGYWHTSGNKILDVNNATVRIAGINWYGFETTDEVVHGLYNQDYKTILDTIYNLGYNVIRLPFSNQMVENPIIPTAISYTDIDGNAINTDLAGLNALQVMDKIITYSGSLNLRIILDDHRSEAGNSAEDSGLWYTNAYPQSAWLADWQTLVTRYQGYTTISGQPTVIGADVRNEPHNAESGGSCWTGDTGATVSGCPTSDTANNWPIAATLAGNTILALNSNWLIFVEGTDYYDGIGDWWGGNLIGVASHPVILNTAQRLVYSAHDYGPDLFSQTWFNSNTTYASLSAIWNQFWGYISADGIAPVWIGEFGTDNTVIDIENSQQGSQGQWFQSIVAYLSANSVIGWTYYALNGDDSYALVDYNYDPWPANPTKQQLLNSIQPPYNTATNGYLGQPASEQSTGGVNIAGNLFVEDGITTNSNIIAKLGRFASGVISNGMLTANQGFTSNTSATINGDLILTRKGTPGAPTGTFSSSGGSLSAGTYYAKLTSVDDSGYTTEAGTESSGVTATGSSGKIVWTWTAVSGTSSYRIYVGTSSGGESSYFATSANSYTQTTSTGTTGTPPTTNETGSIVLPTTTTGCLQAISGLVIGTGSSCGAGAGTVTSVGMTVPNIMSVTPSTITTSGTFAVTLVSETANYAFLAPDGSSGTPTFRAISANDITTALTSPPVIGGTTAAAGTFTTLSANTSVYSPIGNLTTVNSTTANLTNINSSGTAALTTVTASTLSSGSVTDTGLIAAGYVTNTRAGILGTVATIPNSGLTNSATTVNGQTCTLGSTCTVTAVANEIIVGTTSVNSGTTGYILYDNGGTLGNLATTGTGSVVLAASPTITGTLTTGNITESSSNLNTFVNTTAASNVPLVTFYASNATTGTHCGYMTIGRGASTNESASIIFSCSGGSGSSNNFLGLGFYNNDYLINIFGTGDVSIGSTTDCGGKLCITGELSLTTLAAATSNTLCYNTSTVSGFDTLSTCSSLRKYKTNIHPLFGGLNEVMELSPISYLSKTSGREEIGFIAEDMEKIDVRNVTYDGKGKLTGVQYDHMIALLTEAVQEQQHEIDELKREIRKNKNTKTTLTQ